MASNQTLELQRAKFEALLNGKYHADREAFLDSWDRLITFGVLVTGATAFLDVVGNSLQGFGAGFLTLFALIQLVYGLPIRARKHANLRERYFDIAARLEAKEIDPARAKSQMLALAGSEDPPYCACHAIAENWASLAVYGGERPKPCSISWWQNQTRNWLRHSGATF